jgi:asparaginyl-tRNA synthetase
MDTVRIGDFGSHVGEEVVVQGWLHNKRSSGKLRFLIVRDGSGYAQAVVFKKAVSTEAWEAVDAAGQESTLQLTGLVKKDDRAPGGYEIDVKSIEVLQSVHDFPITPKEHGTAFLMENRHLWLRSTRQHAIARVRHTVVKDTPIFTPAACEGTTTLFGVPYFDEGTAYLTQSGQLYNEATAAAHGKVYCFGPTFRAEKSKTRRHLTEFWMVEPEIAFAHLDDAIDLAEGLVCAVVEQCLEKRSEELARLERDTTPLENVERPFPRLHYDDAIKLVQEKGSETQWGSDFGGTDETVIAEAHDRPVVVHRFPAQTKAFYMATDPDRPELSLSADILAPEGYGEIVGGGERLADHDVLLAKIRGHDLPEEAFQWYLDLRKYGSVPHAGFGMGIERVVTWICGIDHLRETIAFPRMLYRIYP